MVGIRLQQNRVPVYVHKTSNQSSSDGTNLSDVTEMSWPVDPGGIYVIEFVILQSAAASTTGLVLALNGPASPTFIEYAGRAAAGGSATFHGGATAYDTAIVSTGVLGAATPSLFNLNGYLVNGVNAGTLTLRMRTEVDTSAAVVRRGSHGSLLRLA